MSAEITNLIQLVSSIGVTGMLTAALYGIYKGWWVTGQQHKEIVADRDRRYTEMMDERDVIFEEIRKDRDAWRDVALGSQTVLDTVSNVAAASIKRFEGERVSARGRVARIMSDSDIRTPGR